DIARLPSFPTRRSSDLDSGYMARVAFILDRIFRRFGVSGRAFIPMIMGFGCSVPAVVNTRTLADDKERIMTTRVIPFFTCGAKADRKSTRLNSSHVSIS